jgi:hypothetical protein
MAKKIGTVDMEQALETFGPFKVHPLASAYPLMPPGDAWEAFKKSVMRGGIQTPIAIDSKTGWVVDGRNRLKAYYEVVAEQAAKGGPTLERYSMIGKDECDFRNTGEIISFIRTRNEFRRQLTQDALALCVAEMQAIQMRLDGKAAKAKGLQKKGEPGHNPHGRKGKESARTDSCELISEPQRDHKAEHARSTVGKLAAEAGVSHHKAAQAIKAMDLPVKQKDTVKRGEKGLKDVLPKAPKAKAVEPAAESPQLNLAKEAYEKLVETVGELSRQDLDAYHKWQEVRFPIMYPDGPKIRAEIEGWSPEVRRLYGVALLKRFKDMAKEAKADEYPYVSLPIP